MHALSGRDDLVRLFADHKLLADTSFLMHPAFSDFLHRHRAVFERNPILTPAKVVNELKGVIARDDDRRQLAEACLRLIADARTSGVLQFRGELADDHANVDQVLSRVVEQHLGQHAMLVFTNDRRLKDYLYAKLQNGCFRTDTSFRVVRFGPNTGRPHVWRPSEDGPRPGPGPVAAPIPAPPPNGPPPPTVRRFRTGVPLADGLTTTLTARTSVGDGGVVYAGRCRPVRLTGTLGVGGEGTVYRTDRPQRVCKVYHPDRLTAGLQRKIELMASRPVSAAGLCWPEEAVYDADGMFRGFLMPEAAGEPLGTGLFHPYPWLRERPNWTRRDSVRVAVQILEHIARLHARGVLLGDINAGNFLVDDNGRVFLVDCDSYQVEGYPCPVGHPNFVAPELQGVNFARTLRTEEHELFAVATLLFMILVPGKAPYSHAGGTDVAADIRQGHFPYPLGKKGQDKAPEGVWRLCWSHLSRPLKEKFYASFHADHRDRPRVPVSEWLSEFREYARVLGRNANVFVGPKPQFGFDLSILPENFRYVPGRNRTPGDGPTDLQRFLDRLTAQVSGSAAPPPLPAVVPLTPAPKSSLPPRVPSRPHPPVTRTKPAHPQPPAPQPAAQAGPFFSLFAAVYESVTHPAVTACWKFHDQFLKRSAVGRLCSGAATLAGAPLAALVRCLPVSRVVLRPALAPFVGLFRAVTR